MSKASLFLIGAIVCFLTKEVVLSGFGLSQLLASLFNLFGVIFVLYFVEALFIDRELNKNG